MKKIDSACANTIINYFIERGKLITHLKTQKLLYFSVGHCLAKNNRYIVEEKFQAWQFGPVLPGVYNSLKKYGEGQITELIEWEDGQCYLYKEDEVFEGIKYTINKLKDFSAWELVDLSHDDDGPWLQTVKTKGLKAEIEIDDIKQHFINKVVFA